MNYFQLVNHLSSLYTKHQGKTFTSKGIVAILDKAVPYRESKFVCNNTLNVHRKNLQVCGVYDPDLDADNLPPIEIEIAFPKKDNSFEFGQWDLTQTQWNNLVIDVCCVLGHEFIHMQQFRRRNFRYGRSYVYKSKVKELSIAEDYYGTPDEIDAYAWAMAANMAVGLSLDQKPYAVEQTGIWKTYETVFDKNHPVIFQLQNKAAKYYKRLEKQYHDTYK